MTASVAIPGAMELGEPILFDRYDRRERMDRELNSFTPTSTLPPYCFSNDQPYSRSVTPIGRKDAQQPEVLGCNE